MLFVDKNSSLGRLATTILKIMDIPDLENLSPENKLEMFDILDDTKTMQDKYINGLHIADEDYETLIERINKLLEGP